MKVLQLTGMPVTLELKVPLDRLEEMADKATNGDKSTLGQFVPLKELMWYSETGSVIENTSLFISKASHEGWDPGYRGSLLTWIRY